MPVLNQLDAKGPEPEYETVELRDLDVCYSSGIRNECLEPQDTYEVNEKTGDISVKIHATGRVVVFLGRNMECYTLLTRPHRRIKK